MWSDAQRRWIGDFRLVWVILSFCFVSGKDVSAKSSIKSTNSCPLRRKSGVSMGKGEFGVVILRNEITPRRRNRNERNMGDVEKMRFILLSIRSRWLRVFARFSVYLFFIDRKSWRRKQCYVFRWQMIQNQISRCW